MSRTINAFTAMIFVYSFVVCLTCKQYHPNKVGNIENISVEPAVMETKLTKEFTDELTVSQEDENQEQATFASLTIMHFAN